MKETDFWKKLNINCVIDVLFKKALWIFTGALIVENIYLNPLISKKLISVINTMK